MNLLVVLHWIFEQGTKYEIPIKLFIIIIPYYVKKIMNKFPYFLNRNVENLVFFCAKSHKTELYVSVKSWGELKDRGIVISGKMEYSVNNYAQKGRSV